MICRVHNKGKKTRRLLDYLFDERRAGHSNAHLIAGWRSPATLEPPARPDGRRDLTRLCRLLEAPLAAIENAEDKNLVWHCSLSAAPEDPDLTDAQWARFTAEVMHRLGLDVRGQEENAVPWVCVRHASGHVHLVAVLARPDGRRAHLHREYVRLSEAARWAEREFGLRMTARPDRTAPKNPSRAETEKAARSGRPEAARTAFRRQVEAAAAAAANEAGFLASLEARGLLVRLRLSPDRRRRVIGYAVGQPGDVTKDGRQVWFGGGKLAPYLSLPKLRRRWGDPLTGHRMTRPTARIVLRREVTAAASAAPDESAFAAELAARGLIVTWRTAPGRPRARTGYSVTLPGLTDRAGQPVRFAGGTLDDSLTLGNLRIRWRAGRHGAAPPDLYAGADAEAVWEHAGGAARFAAAEMQAGKGGADVALATADVLTVAADVTGSTELRRAADSFGRAARIPGGRRVPAPDPVSRALRTSARLMAASRPPGRYRAGYGSSGSALAILALVIAIVVIAVTLAVLRARQRRADQARNAMDAGLRLVTAADAWTPPLLLPQGGVVPARTAGKRPARPASARRRGTDGSPRSRPRL